MQFPIPALFLGRLPRKRHLVIRIRGPPELDGNLDAKLAIIYNHGRKNHDKCERGVRHEKGKEGVDMSLPCLLPHEAEDDGNQLDVNAVKESRSRVDCSGSHRRASLRNVVL
jgi:hypothetical protein